MKNRIKTQETAQRNKCGFKQTRLLFSHKVEFMFNDLFGVTNKGHYGREKGKSLT